MKKFSKFYRAALYSCSVLMLVYTLLLSGGCRKEKPAASLAPPPAPTETAPPETLYAGHSAPTEPGEITTRQAHHDTLLQLLDEFDTKEELGPARKRLGHYGVDVSRWQNNIEWATIKADSVPHPIGFIFVKATQGRALVDSRFSKNWADAQKHKFRVGAYHFYRYKDDPLEQARNYIKTVPLSKGNLLPIVDVELDCAGCTTPGIPTPQLIENLKKYVAAIEQHYGVKPIIYTYQGFYHQYLKNHFLDHYYWMALYRNTPPADMSLYKNQPLEKDPKIVCWQFTDSGKLNGIASTVDMNFLPAQFEHLVFIK